MRIILVVLLLFVANVSLALTTIERNDPKNLVSQATDELLVLSKAAEVYFQSDPERYYASVAEILDQVVDKDYFARGVMATYASARLYKSLKTDEERAVFRARIDRFSDSLEDVLIRKYADALLAFNAERIEISEPNKGSGDEKVTLNQIVYGKDKNTYSLQYNLHQKPDGLWLIYNVIVEGINLGATYRNQFSEAVEVNKGDVDYVVEHWTSLMIRQSEAPDNTLNR